ncbi:MAG: J domain-containing protein [Anaerolineae bacterium]|nr:J domain-containing protein [Anaerolineae bacterium]
MAQRITTWLQAQISRIASVRNVTLDPGGALVASTWTSGVVHIHLLDELPKTRLLKRVMQDNTRVGIGTLFLINARCVPADGSVTAPDEALLGLHALYRDRLYSFSQSTGGAPRIGQIHFRAFNTRGDLREVWYGPDVAVRNLPCYRVWVSHPLSLKGNWMVANFGSEAFWKDADYTIGREAFRRERQRSGDGGTQYTTWSQPGWEPGGAQGYQTPADPPPARESDLDRSYSVMGLSRGASGEEVKTAFRRLAREVHPDVSTLPKAEAEMRFKILLDAYNKIKVANGW